MNVVENDTLDSAPDEIKQMFKLLHHIDKSLEEINTNISTLKVTNKNGFIWGISTASSICLAILIFV